MEQFKIISTLGPASLNREFLQVCQELGQATFRLNGSHLSPPELTTYLEFLRRNTTDPVQGIYLDLQGNKMRIGKLATPRRIKVGQTLEFVLEKEAPEPLLPLPQRGIFATVEPGDHLVLQDGSLEMVVTGVDATHLTVEVTKGGLLRSGSGITIRNKTVAPEFLIESQKQQIEIARGQRVDSLAISYLQREEELHQWRAVCREMDYNPRITAKIEHPRALKNLSALIQHSDEVWFCRGDLGTLIPLKELGTWQEETIRLCREFQKPVVIAGQVFHHLTFFPDPTRSEVVHFHQIRQQGAVGIVLSDETAIGKDPVNAVRKVVELI